MPIELNLCLFISFPLDFTVGSSSLNFIETFIKRAFRRSMESPVDNAILFQFFGIFLWEFSFIEM